MKSIRQDEKIINETKNLVELFLQTNASDIELSKMTDISSSTVGRRLTNQDYILKAFPDTGDELFRLIKEKRQDNLLRGKVLGGQTTLLNHVYKNAGDNNSSIKLSLDAISTNHMISYNYLMHAVLTFRVHLDVLSTLFQIDIKELEQNLLSIATKHNHYEAMRFLIEHDARDQNRAYADFMYFWKELVNAIRNKNQLELDKLKNVISDAKAKKVRDNHKLSKKLSNEDVYILAKYQVKYALRVRDMENLFGISHVTFNSRLPEVLEYDAELKSLYYYLLDYNENRYKKST